jgi:hypothetical protein
LIKTMIRDYQIGLGFLAGELVFLMFDLRGR